MKELVEELQTIRKEAAEWDPDGNIEWDIIVYVLSLESGFTYEGQKRYFFDIDEGKKTRDYINKTFPHSKPAKLLKVVVKLNRKENQCQNSKN
jgi:hypothetical protein